MEVCACAAPRPRRVPCQLLRLHAHELAQPLAVEFHLGDLAAVGGDESLFLLLVLARRRPEGALERLHLAAELLDLARLAEALLGVLLDGLLVELHLALQLLVLLLQIALRLLQLVRLLHLQSQLLRHPTVLEEDLLGRSIESLDRLLLARLLHLGEHLLVPGVQERHQNDCAELRRIAP